MVCARPRRRRPRHAEAQAPRAGVAAALVVWVVHSCASVKACAVRHCRSNGVMELVRGQRPPPKRTRRMGRWPVPCSWCASVALICLEIVVVVICGRGRRVACKRGPGQAGAAPFPSRDRARAPPVVETRRSARLQATEQPRAARPPPSLDGSLSSSSSSSGSLSPRAVAPRGAGASDGAASERGSQEPTARRRGGDGGRDETRPPQGSPPHQPRAAPRGAGAGARATGERGSQEPAARRHGGGGNEDMHAPPGSRPQQLPAAPRGAPARERDETTAELQRRWASVASRTPQIRIAPSPGARCH